MSPDYLAGVAAERLRIQTIMKAESAKREAPASYTGSIPNPIVNALRDVYRACFPSEEN